MLELVDVDVGVAVGVDVWEGVGLGVDVAVSVCVEDSLATDVEEGGAERLHRGVGVASVEVELLEEADRLPVFDSFEEEDALPIGLVVDAAVAGVVALME